MYLTVGILPVEDTWKDIIRIHKTYRKDNKGRPINRGTVCCIAIAGKSRWVVVHGLESEKSIIQMDLTVRLSLNVEMGQKYDFTIKPIPWLKTLWFPWKASDPIYRVPAQLSLIALILGVLLGVTGIIISLIPIYQDQHKETRSQFCEPSATPTPSSHVP
jgi:hypothetical protein